MYTDRGPTTTDLDSSILECIYSGLQKDVGRIEATNFAKFVANLNDLSASAFIQAFERFWYSGCKETTLVQPKNSGRRITGETDEDCLIEAQVLVANALCRLNESPESREEDVRFSPARGFGGWRDESPSDRIKSAFVRQHKQEIGAI
jgi:hypothetical protein